MAAEYVIAFDLGTSGVKAAVTDMTGRIVASRTVSYSLTTLADGWVDQDVEQIMRSIALATGELLDADDVGAADIAGIGVTGQMFNVVPVDAGGEPLMSMIHWLDLRTTAQERRLRDRIAPDEQFRMFGSLVTAKDVIPKIMWLREERPDVWRRTAWLLDCKDAVIARLAGTAGTDFGTANAFHLLDAATAAWIGSADDLIPGLTRRLPPVGPSCRVAGSLGQRAAAALGLPTGTPIVVGGGDVLATQVGSGAIADGDVQLSLGTAAYWGVTLAQPGLDPGRRVGPLTHMDPELSILWLEIATAGGAMAWFLRVLEGEGAIDQGIIDRLLRGTAPDDVPIFAPWLTGERAPIFDDEIRGAFVGLKLAHGRGHLLRAVAEGVALQIRWAFDYALSFGGPVGSIRVIGGGALSDAWLQIIADAIERPLLLIDGAQEAGARGAAQTVLVTLGVEPDFGFASRGALIVRSIDPDADGSARLRARYAIYRGLYEALRVLPTGG